jgi:hypothetical protein
MTLADFPPPWKYETCVTKALVFSAAIGERLAELHALHGTTNLVPVPSQLPDGRLFVCGDLLTEVMPGGLLHAMWEAADKNVLAQAVTVMPWADAVALLPADPVEA